MSTRIDHDITAAAVARFGTCDDPRLRELLTSLVRHLHAFVQETRLTEAEWQQGIEFLTATGHMCDEKRQEFILLSDVLGVSMLTVAQNQGKPPGTTEATVLGPFHVAGSPSYEQGEDIAAGAPGEPLFVDCTVRGQEGEAVAGASVEVWQADAEGHYDVQLPELARHRARGVLRSDARGRVRFRTVLPVPYSVPTDGPVGRLLRATGRHPWRPAHIHFRIEAAGYETLTTHVFRAGDPYLDSDVVFGVRHSLVADYVAPSAGAERDRQPASDLHHVLTFDFVLAPEAMPSTLPV